MSLSKREYHDLYGEEPIYCRVHKINAIDSCPACDELEETSEEDSQLHYCFTHKIYWTDECGLCVNKAEMGRILC